jgi:hypothetical protein
MEKDLCHGRASEVYRAAFAAGDDDGGLVSVLWNQSGDRLQVAPAV